MNEQSAGISEPCLPTGDVPTIILRNPIPAIDTSEVLLVRYQRFYRSSLALVLLVVGSVALAQDGGFRRRKPRVVQDTVDDVVTEISDAGILQNDVEVLAAAERIAQLRVVALETKLKAEHDASLRSLAERSILEETIKIVFTAILSIAGGFWITAKKVWRSGPRTRLFHRKNTVLLVGLGRSGKSSIISSLATPEKRATLTNDFSITRCRFSNANVDSELILADYRGQSFRQLISSFINEQFKWSTEIRYGDIDSLILVVDVRAFVGRYNLDDTTWATFKASFPKEWDALNKYRKDQRIMLDEISREIRGSLSSEADRFLNSHLSDTSTSVPEPDKTRVAEHLAAWNEQALDAVFALLTDEIKYVALFINKIDKLQANPDEARRLSTQAFARLRDDLRARCGKQTVFELICGVAADDGLGPLRRRLATASVPLGPKDGETLRKEAQQ